MPFDSFCCGAGEVTELLMSVLSRDGLSLRTLNVECFDDCAGCRAIIFSNVAIVQMLQTNSLNWWITDELYRVDAVSDDMQISHVDELGRACASGPELFAKHRTYMPRVRQGAALARLGSMHQSAIGTP